MHIPNVKKILAWTVLLGTAWLAACSGGAAIGDDCGAAGATTDECEDGGVCSDDGSGALKCLVIYTDQSDCANGEDCNGVTGSSIKGCRTAKQ